MCNFFSESVNIEKNINKTGFLFFIYNSREKNRKKMLPNQNKQDKFCPFSKITIKVKGDTAQKMKFSITDFFSKCDKIRSFLRIWSHSRKKSLMENFIFCAVLLLRKHSLRIILSQGLFFMLHTETFLNCF